jgi:hypothetical protein
VAEETAKAELASEIARAAMYGQNPEYVTLLTAQAWAAAYSKMDKVILPPNVSPFMFIGGGTAPTLTLPVTNTVATK